MKQCKYCNNIKILDEFYPHPGTKDKLRGQCKQCCTELTRKRRKDDPEKYKQQCDLSNKKLKEYQFFWRLKKNFNLEKETFLQMLKDQNYVCKICNKPENRKKTSSLSVDHNHSTGKIRGLLCDLCNKGLGHFKDDINLLNNAIIYLNNN